MADNSYSWPKAEETSALGKRVNRIDGVEKASGRAKYTYDIQLPKQLIARALGCPHAHCKIVSIDTSVAEKVPGVVHVHVFEKAKPGSEIQWQGELIAAIAAESDGAAVEGLSKLKIQYEMLEVFVDDANLAAAQAANRATKGGGKEQTEREPGDDDDEKEFVTAEFARLFKESKYVIDGFYGIDAITHCCLEPHGATVAWNGDKLLAYLSTQNVSGTDEQFADGLKIAADDVEVRCEHIGGGFGSKFAPDYWGVAAAEISRATGRPVKLMLDRDQELKIAGNRPSAYLKVKLGADANGVIQVWDSEHWTSGGATGGGVPHNGVIPYVFEPKNYRRSQINIQTNLGPQRAWRAPNHPQACAITHTAIDDLAARMGADSMDIFLRNLGTDDARRIGGAKPSVYRAEIELAAKLMDWKAKWHPHGKGAAKGSVVDGLGLAIHTWGGGANDSNCNLKIHPDGSVETFCGTQDLGVGTRTAIALVLSETLGIPYTGIKVNLGSSKLPVSGPSGGSTTIGGVSESHRRAATDALAKIGDLVAKKLGVAADTLVAANSRIGVKGQPDKSLSWKEACNLIGMRPLEVTGSFKRGTPSPLSNSTVGGVQMAHVLVDKDTGVVKINKFVAVQDMGLVVARKQAESQIYGAIIMGIASALFEQRIADRTSGAFLNSELRDYKLARLGDIGDIVVEIYEPESERSRGVIGLGEPPVISPGAAISNAVANALGVRVPVLPLTPQRVLEALQKAGRA